VISRKCSEPNGRSLSAAIEAIRTSKSFTHFDALDIRLPWFQGSEVIIRVSTVGLQLITLFDFDYFIYAAMQGSLHRPPAEYATLGAVMESAYASGPSAFKTACQGIIEDFFNSTEYTDANRNNYQFVF
jgi:hypothetical protein